MTTTVEWQRNSNRGTRLIEARPHDLVRLSRPLEVVPEGAPPWVANALRAAPWVVVLRASSSQGRVAVGVRGAARSHRFAMRIHDTVVMEVLTPEDLTMRIAELKRALPATRALRALSALLANAAVPWGPIGSVGFELASGVPAVTLSSELDVLIRPVGLPARAWMMRLHVALQRLPARVDCQVETDDGALALCELVSGARDVLLRTPTGPRLIPAPWPNAAVTQGIYDDSSDSQIPASRVYQLPLAATTSSAINGTLGVDAIRDNTLRRRPSQ